MQTIWRPAAATPAAIITATISTSDMTTYKTTAKLPKLHHYVPLLCLKASLRYQNGLHGILIKTALGSFAK